MPVIQAILFVIWCIASYWLVKFLAQRIVHAAIYMRRCGAVGYVLMYILTCALYAAFTVVMAYLALGGWR